MIHRLEPRRLRSASDADLNFGDDGIAVADIGRQASAFASTVQPDGKILVAGRVNENGMLARFNADGSPDATFGANGVSRLNLGDIDNFREVLVLDTGKILVSGSTYIAGATQATAFLARFRADGVLDTGTRFGRGDGIYKLPAGEMLTGMTVGSGKIFTVGGNVVRRHNLGTGTLDTGFDTDGLFDLEAQTVLDQAGADDVVVSDSGKIAVTGLGQSQDATERKFPQRVGGAESRGSVIVMLNPNATLDNAFDANGVSFYDGNGPRKLLFIPSGTLFAAAASAPFSFESSVGLYEFAPDGSYDFNPSRLATTPATIAQLSSGKILIAGDDAATRFNADGTLDLTYSTDGTAQALTLFPEHKDFFDQWGNLAFESSAAAVLPDGSAVVVNDFARRGQLISDPDSLGPIALRKLLANPPSIEATVSLGGDATLTITGSSGDDVMSFENDSDNHRLQLTINEQVFLFPTSSVQRATARLGAGNDYFNGLTNSTPVPLFIDGEAGNDTLYGSNGNDTLLGGLSGDYVQGYGGDDSLYGNGGKDTLYGDEGADRLDGGQSNDAIFGGSSTDRLIGGDGIDEMFGDGGDDLFYSSGDGANDNLFGGSGDDLAHADAGDVLASIEMRQA